MNSLLLLLSIVAVALGSTSGRYDFQQNDINTLNYALTLEHLEYAFYRDGLNTFTPANFLAAGYNATVYSYFTLIKSHENSHVNTLISLIQARGGTPVNECTYNFGYGNSVTAFVEIAQLLENTGVSAYDGAIDDLTELDLITGAATIATVEARHAAYLNQLVGKNISEDGSRDIPLEPSVVIATVKDNFITSCDAVTTQNTIVPQRATFALNNDTNQAAANANDIKTLQYALILERFEANFYNFYINETYNATDFINAGYNASVYENYQMITNFENAHVEFLASTLESLNVVPLGECRYNYSTIFNARGNLTAFLVLSAQIQKTGVGAFNGAVNAISNLDFRTAAATIATVEGRLASYANLVINEIPFPDDFDVEYSPAEVVSMVSKFILDCPYTISDYFPVPANFSEAAQISGSLVESSTESSASSGSASSASSGSASSASSDSASSASSGSASSASSDSASSASASSGGSASSGSASGTVATTGTSGSSIIAASTLLIAVVLSFM